MKESELIFGLMAAFNKPEYTIQDLIYLIKPFHVSESSLRTTLSRMSNRGVLQSKREGRRAFYRFTAKGSAISNNVARSFISPDWSQWDESYWGILFSIPEINKNLRHKIRKKLSAFRFAPLHPGFWIRPFNAIEKIKLVLKDIFNNKNCQVIKFTQFKAAFHNDIDRLWHLKKINDGFCKGAQLIKKKRQKMKNLSPKQALVEKMAVGEKVVKALFKDPLLPPVLLPEDWQGHNLRAAFLKWDQDITQLARPYWVKILKNN